MSLSSIDTTSFLANYTVKPSSYDELRDKNGVVNPQWEKTIAAYAAMGPEEINSRYEQGLSEIARNGIAYNPHDDEHARTRPLKLNILPYNISQSEWDIVQAGIEQWATLGDLVLKSLFGSQDIIKKGIVPPDLLYAHPQYHPAYHVVHDLDETRLHLCASDLARSGDGRWWATNFRTRSPFGLGYVIENRIMMSELSPEIYQNKNFHRIAPFFMSLREQLASLDPNQSRNPRIVLWSPGPGSASYFEDAYLARYLNYTLLLSADMTVRKGRVFLKTLRGLVPVDVILRRIDDDQCDSTELNNHSTSDVAGLVETIRSKSVGILNGLGCALLEAPIYYAFANSLSKHLLGEELKLAPVATWWCGDATSLDYVLEHIDSLVIRPAFGTSDDVGIQSLALSPDQKSDLITKIKENPHAYVGQEIVQQSSTPVWNDSMLKAWDLELRGYCLSSDNAYETLHGGLAFISDPNAPSDTSGSEFHVQDVRVVSDTPVEPVTLLAPDHGRIELKRRGTDLPSRVCDNFFWLGRTLERMDAMVRIQRVACRVSTGEYDATLIESFLDHVFAPESDSGIPEPVSVASFGTTATRHLRRPEIFEKGFQGGLQNLCAQALQLASTVRDHIALEMWRTLRSIEEKNDALYNCSQLGDAIVKVRLDDLLGALSSLFGLVHESMTRTDSWNFLDLGRKMERAIQTSKLIRKNFTAPNQDEVLTLELILEIVDSIMTYRGRYLSVIQIAPVIDLLLCDDTNPRSIAFQLGAIQNHVHTLHRHEDHKLLGNDQRLALMMNNAVHLCDVHKLSMVDKDNAYPKLAKHLLKMEGQLAKLSDAISAQYFVHAGQQRHFATTMGETDEV